MFRRLSVYWASAVAVQILKANRRFPHAKRFFRIISFRWVQSQRHRRVGEKSSEGSNRKGHRRNDFESLHAMHSSLPRRELHIVSEFESQGVRRQWTMKCLVESNDNRWTWGLITLEHSSPHAKAIKTVMTAMKYERFSQISSQSMHPDLSQFPFYGSR